MKVQRNENEALYTRILREELQMALGCTEPVTIAFASAYARKLLGTMPDRIEALCSGNIIKNVKAVTVPETDGRKGIEAAVLIGAIGGNPEKGMKVLEDITEADRRMLDILYQKNIVSVKLLDTEHVLHVVIHAFSGENNVSVEILDSHTELGEVVVNGKVFHQRQRKQDEEISREFMNVRDIVSYADHVPLDQVRDVLEAQIECNTKIAEEGMKNRWGSEVGKRTEGLNFFPFSEICSGASAGSDARMNGCPLPVVINSGSGNQGITASVPVILYAREKGIEEERILRALCVSNLITIHQKTGIGKLSAFCGVVSAAAGAVCGIAYLNGETVETILEIIVNSTATCGGMICDGAKSSCAAKIATALYSAFLGYELAKNKTSFRAGEGIVADDAEQTIANIGRVASKGMRSTDREILEIMLGQ
ncbi:MULTISPECIES: L-serine ammonia-lyase, iron-sulfur-dependent, subunit alpha [Eubacteriales]|uniref:L-cysteine desulfidase family protein n=1 Tax=Eubacteriales TaxID=186802 RepID=UPI000A98016C|nr:MULTISPECIES: L-serine ammonia-lyase, iron-sulfur-dependent, subunit alpha [Eubacteriales]